MENRYYEFKITECFETLEIEFTHPEYSMDCYTVVMRCECNEVINWIDVACDMWDRFNKYGVMFDMKITAYYTIHGLKKSEYPDLIPSDNPTWERVVYEGGNPHYAEVTE